jgi:alkaline phosphatase
MMAYRKWSVSAALAVLLLFAFVGMGFAGGTQENKASAAAPAAEQTAERAKYVFLFIGDGMAAPQVNSAEVYKSTTTGAGLKATEIQRAC